MQFKHSSLSRDPLCCIISLAFTNPHLLPCGIVKCPPYAHYTPEVADLLVNVICYIVGNIQLHHMLTTVYMLYFTCLSVHTGVVVTVAAPGLCNFYWPYLFLVVK